MKHYAYYNEIDPTAAQWLRNLIAAGHIAPGIVDERSIEDVTPYDLRDFTQCHFFAGIGVWSYALRRAGWDDSRPVWTGSCPCQPFSSAGAQAGFDDERHLWPAFHWLIQQCQPTVVFGEQVASKVADPWVDLVHADLEALDYTFGCVPFPSAGVGAPHIRDRLFWVGHSNHAGLEGHPRNDGAAGWAGSARPAPEAGISGGMADTNNQRQHRFDASVRAGTVGDAKAPGLCDAADWCVVCSRNWEGCICKLPSFASFFGGDPRPTNGFWRAADWLACRDGKWRAVEPGTFPLANGAAARVVRLRAYGNAINAEAARHFIEAYLESAERGRPDLVDDLL